MRASSYAVLHLFLSKCSIEKQNRLKSLLPDDLRAEIDSIPPLKEQVELSHFSYQDLFDDVHYSWMIPTLESYTNQEQGFFLQSLKGETLENLEEIFPTTKITISETGKEFLLSILIQSLIGETQTLLPKKALPPSKIQFLLEYSKDELVELIDYLALYDLTLEMRRIVETKILKRIYSFLSEDKREFIKKLMTYKEPFNLPQFRIPSKEDDFNLALHKRGLKRLAFALSNEHPDFIWYICHHLDIGRGNALYKYCAKKAPSQVAEGIQKNIQEIADWSNG